MQVTAGVSGFEDYLGGFCRVEPTHRPVPSFVGRSLRSVSLLAVEGSCLSIFIPVLEWEQITILVLCYGSVVNFLNHSNRIGCSRSRDKKAQKMRESKLTVL